MYAIEEAKAVGVNLDYFVPKSGGNIWFDGWVIPKYAKNVLAANEFAAFLMRPENAIRVMDYIGYPSCVGGEEVYDPADPVEDWLATEGSSVRSLLTQWGDKAGWRVVWSTDREYVLEAGAMFRGRFMDVASAILRSFARAAPAPWGTFYKGNRVLVVTTQEDENADD